MWRERVKMSYMFGELKNSSKHTHTHTHNRLARQDNKSPLYIKGLRHSDNPEKLTENIRLPKAPMSRQTPADPVLLLHATSGRHGPAMSTACAACGYKYEKPIKNKI